MNPWIIVIGILLLPALSHADYRARCLGAHGKETRCRIEVVGDGLRIRLGMKGEVTVRGQDITSLTIEKSMSVDSQKKFLEGAGVAIPAHGMTVIVPLTTESPNDVLLGLQFLAPSTETNEGEPTTQPTTMPMSPHAILIQTDSKSAAGLKLQMEALSGKKFENR